LKKTSEKDIYRQHLMLTQTELVSKNSKCKWRTTKGPQKQGKRGDRGQEARQQWLALYYNARRPCRRGVDNARGPYKAQKALRGWSSRV
jgi:hypothetical protein